MEYTPINLGINTANPLDGYYQGLQDRAKLDLAKAQTNQANAQTDAYTQKTIADNLKAQQEVQQQANNQALLQKIVSPNATLDDYKQYALINPSNPNAQKLWESKDKDQKLAILQPASQIGVALKAGNTQLALDTVNNSIDAFNNSGDTQNAGVLGVLKKTIEEHPELALAGVLNSLMQIDGGDKIVGQILGKPQADIAQTEAQTNQANATTAKTKADTVGQNINNLYAPQKTALDLQNTQSTIAKNQAELQNIGSQINERQTKLINPELSGDAQKRIYEAQDSIRTNDSAISSIDNILGQFNVIKKQSGGVLSRNDERFNKLVGDSGIINNVRTQINALNAKLILANKPPGSFSDADLKFAQSTIIDATSDPAVIERYLNVTREILETDKNIRQTEVDWVSANGGLGTARKNIEVNGVLVPRGTKFSDFSKAPNPKAPPTGQTYLKYNNGK